MIDQERDARGWTKDGICYAERIEHHRWNVGLLPGTAARVIEMGEVYSAPIDGFWYGAQVLSRKAVLKEASARRKQIRTGVYTHTSVEEGTRPAYITGWQEHYRFVSASGEELWDNKLPNTPKTETTEQPA